MRKALAIVAVILFVVALTLATSQRGGLAYFSPHTLEYRTQSERTIFAISVPIYRSRFRRVDNPLVDMLITEGFVTPQSTETDRWEVVFHWSEAWRDGYGPLYDILHRNREEIIEWSRNNPECARIYWSEVFRLLRSENQADIITGREVLRRCRRIEDVDELRQAIDRVKGEVANLFAT